MVSEDATWKQILRNIEQEGEQTDKITLSKEAIKAFNDLSPADIKNYKIQEWQVIIFSFIIPFETNCIYLLFRILLFFLVVILLV